MSGEHSARDREFYDAQMDADGIVTSHEQLLESKLQEALTTLESEVSRQALTDFSTRSSHLDAARSAVEHLFREQQEEIAAARRTSEYWKAELLAANAEVASLKSTEK